MVRKVLKYKCETNAQIIVAPEVKDSATVFGSKLWPRPGGEPENRLVAPIQIHGASCPKPRGQMWPLREGGNARASVGGRGSFVLYVSLRG